MLKAWQHAALLDKNHDGKLSSAELRTALADSGIDISEATLEELMRDMPSTADAGRSTDGEPQLTKEAFSVSHLTSSKLFYPSRTAASAHALESKDLIEPEPN